MLHAACRCNCMVHLIKKLKTKIKTIKNTTMLMLLQCAMSMSFACAAMQQVRGNGQSTTLWLYGRVYVDAHAHKNPSYNPDFRIFS